MSCKSYRDALIEAAASGAELDAKLHAHLGSCADCRAAFEQERLLFSSIDAGLRVTANAAVPVSLLPRVRVELTQFSEREQEKGAWRPLRVLIPAFAVVCAVVAVVFWQGIARQEVGKGIPSNVAANSGEPVFSLSRPNPRTPAVAGPMESNSGRANRPARSSAQLVRENFPEVLVQPEEARDFEKYLAFLRNRRGPISGASRVEESSLEMSPVELRDVQVKPMVETEVTGN